MPNPHVVPPIAPDTLPEALHELAPLAQWVAFTGTPKVTADGTPKVKADGRPELDKNPKAPRTGRASGTSPVVKWRDTWCDYVTAYRHVMASRTLGGVGFVFTADDPYVGVDIDGCIHADGTVDADVRAIIERFDTYTEISPSGRGLHLLCRGLMPANSPKRRGAFEAYQDGRYFTVTGTPFGGFGSRPIRECTEALEWFVGTVLAPPTPARVVPDPSDEAFIHRLWDGDTDDAFIEQMRRRPAIHRLWDGDTSAHAGDASAADLALCNHIAWWCDGDAARTDGIFRRSGLMRAKWDEAHYAGGGTYGAHTVAVACASVLALPSDKRRRGVGVARVHRTPGTKAGKPAPVATSRGGDVVGGDGFHLTDLGNAERFIAAHRPTLRYVPGFDRWVRWTGTHWAADTSGHGDAHEAAKAVVDAMWRDAAGFDDAGRTAMRRHAQRTEASARIAAMVTLASHDVRLHVEASRFDTSPWLVNATNGTVDVRTGDVHPHRPDDFITGCLPVPYRPDAAAPKWERFLGQIIPDAATRAYLRRAVGYSLTGSTREEAFFILHGSGANGKSTFTKTIERAFGPLAHRAGLDTIMERRHDGGASPELVALRGKRLVVTSESKEGDALNSAQLKAIASDEPFTARPLYREPITITPTHKLWLQTNHRPRVTDTSDGMWRRIRLIPFDVQITPAQRDASLKDTLAGELEGVVAWAVAGAIEWFRNGLQEPAAVRDATDTYRLESDTFAQFLDDECVVHPDAEVGSTEFYAAYNAWCDTTHERRRMTQTAFSTRLARDFDKTRPGKGRVRWHGIGLRTDRDEPSFGPASTVHAATPAPATPSPACEIPGCGRPGNAFDATRGVRTCFSHHPMGTNAPLNPSDT
jgi:putative DNA primase/helicase